MAFNQAFFRVAKTVVVILVGAHVLTCLWHYQTILGDVEKESADGTEIPANWLINVADEV